MVVNNFVTQTDIRLAKYYPRGIPEKWFFHVYMIHVKKAVSSREFESEVVQSQLGPKSDQGDPGRLLFNKSIGKSSTYYTRAIHDQSTRKLGTLTSVIHVPKDMLQIPI